MVRFERSIAFSFPLPFPGKKRTRATTERCRSLFFPTRFAAIVGESEIADGTVTLKHLQSGDQQTVPVADAAAAVAKK